MGNYQEKKGESGEGWRKQQNGWLVKRLTYT